MRSESEKPHERTARVPKEAADGPREESVQRPFTHLHHGAGRPSRLRRARQGAAVMSIGRLARDQETYYLSEVIEGREDFYLDPGEAPGRWTGSLAGEFGLVGVYTRLIPAIW